MFLLSEGMPKKRMRGDSEVFCERGKLAKCILFHKWIFSNELIQCERFDAWDLWHFAVDYMSLKCGILSIYVANSFECIISIPCTLPVNISSKKISWALQPSWSVGGLSFYVNWLGLRGSWFTMNGTGFLWFMPILSIIFSFQTVCVAHL